MALKLPLSVTNRVDLHRLVRELEALDNFIRQNKIRGTQVQLPRLTSSLELLSSENQIDLLDDKQRDAAAAILAKLIHDAPTTHISFSLEPPTAMVQKITEWFRREVHPAMMVQVGIQPTIGAGCVVRTQNKYFDFSLRQHLQRSHGELMKAIHTHVDTQPLTATGVASPQVPTEGVAAS